MIDENNALNAQLLEDLKKALRPEIPAWITKIIFPILAAIGIAIILGLFNFNDRLTRIEFQLIGFKEHDDKAFTRVEGESLLRDLVELKDDMDNHFELDLDMIEEVEEDCDELKERVRILENKRR